MKIEDKIKLYILPGWSYTELIDEQGLLMFSVVRRNTKPFVIKGHSDKLLKLFSIMNGINKVEDIVKILKDDLEKTDIYNYLIALNEKNVLGQLFEGDEKIYSDHNRYIRQIEYFEDIKGSRQVASNMQNRIEDTRILILGVGGVGNWILQGLAAVGFKNFILVDPDVVELSNLSRQILFNPSQVGVDKVEAASDWMKKFNYDANITKIKKAVYCEEDIRELVKVSDIVIRTAGYTPSELGRMINRICLKYEKPYLSVGGASVGPFVIPNYSSCFGCLEKKNSLKSPITFKTIKKNRRTVRDTHTPVYGPQIAVNAMLAVNEIIDYITQLNELKTLNNIIGIDINGLQTTRFKVEKHEMCEDCSENNEVYNVTI